MSASAWGKAWGKAWGGAWGLTGSTPSAGRRDADRFDWQRVIDGPAGAPNAALGRMAQHLAQMRRIRRGR